MSVVGIADQYLKEIGKKRNFHIVNTNQMSI